MDPHQLQNNLGIPGVPGHQNSLQQSYQLFMQPSTQHNPNQYIQQLYQTPQVNNMVQDPSAFFQQHNNLLFGMPGQQQGFYNPQVNQVFQQQLLQQQQQLQQQQLQQQGHLIQPVQQIQQVQQLQQHHHQQHQHELQLQPEQEAAMRQQRMVELQQRQQMEALRKEQELQMRKEEEMAIRKQQEEEARRMAEIREQERIEEERRRILAEEAQRKRLEEEKRQAELLRIKVEEEERKRAAMEAIDNMKARSDSIARPFTLIACTPFTKLSSLLPFPTETMSSSLVDTVSQGESLDLLSSVDENTLNIISHALEGIDVSEVVIRGDDLIGNEDMKHLNGNEPPFISSLIAKNPSILNIDEELHNLLSAFDGTDMDHSISEPGPSTSSSHSTLNVPRDENAIRKMISLGKQPKGSSNNNKRKRDMVESLFDSLTDYFDPCDGRRRRHKAKTYEEEQLEIRELEMIAESEAKIREREKENEALVDDMEELEEGKFFEKKKGKKKEKEPDRPPTPTDVLRQREEEWREREKRRNEKRRARINDNDDMWSNDVRAENESLTRCTILIENILDAIELDPADIDDESEMPPEILIDRESIGQLRGEVQKLKMYKKMHEVPCDRLVRLLTILEWNMRDVIATEGNAPIVPITDEDGGEDEGELFRQMVDDRLIRGGDAACTAMLAMTSYKMPKQVFLEDTMERAVQVCKQYLTYIIYPASDILYQGPHRGKKIVDDKKRKKVGGVTRSPIVHILYTRILDLMSCFAELVRNHSLPDTLYHQLNTTALSCFFVNNVSELQLKAMSVLANIFARGDESTRSSLLTDLLNSLHRLPPKSSSNCYRLSNDSTIGNCTCLFMQLIQSTIKVPKKKKRDGVDDDEDILRDYSKEDSIVKDSYTDAKHLATKFIKGFFTKSTSKGEEECRRLFDIFLQDVLTTLMVPEWPVSEMILSIIGAFICHTLNLRQKVDLSVRLTIFEYLGSICARLRKEKKEALDASSERLGMIVKTLILYERDEDDISMDDIDVSHMSSNELLKKAEQGLIDYLVVSHSSSEVSIEYAVKYYVGEWYRMTLEDIELLRINVINAKNNTDNEKEKRKADRKLEKAQEKGNKQREFLIELSDKKHIKRRTDIVSRSNSMMLDTDALWLIKYLALQREFCNSFDTLLNQILLGITTEGAVGLRTRAMKSLTQIIEVDYTLLQNDGVRRSVGARMTDPNAQVREATIELLGKFIICRPDLIDEYYQVLIERIKDSGTSVRKRVIRIMREYCERNPEYTKSAEMISRIVRRVNDEEGVKKLVLDTLATLWLQPCKYKEQLYKKVDTLTQVISLSIPETGGIESLEMVFNSLLKGDADRSYIAATTQIVDTLVDNVIQLEMNDASSTIGMDIEEAKMRQDAMLASLAGLSIFSKVRASLLLKHVESLQPYLTMSVKTTTEQSVLNQVITMLERVIPLIDHPSSEFIQRVDNNLGALLKNSGMILTTSAISCAAALHKKAPKLRPSSASLFLNYLKALLAWKKKLEGGLLIKMDVMPAIQRSVFCLGLMVRYYDWDDILDGDDELNGIPLIVVPSIGIKDEEDREGDDKEIKVKRTIRDSVYILLTFFSQHQNEGLRHKALTSLGHLCAEYPEYLQRSEVLNLYSFVMRSNDVKLLPLKIQALRNLELFLTNEEKKAIKSNVEWEKNKDNQELKEMELAGSGLGSAVIQKYWPLSLETYFHPLVDVRMAAMQVVWQTLSQGLVTPGNSIHVLIAMSTDPLVAIRHKVENLVKDIDNKYQGMVQSKAVAGVRASFRLQSTISTNGSIIRGIRSVDQTATANAVGRDVPMVHGAPKWTNDGQALLSGLYQSLRTNRQQRRSVVNSMLRLFSEDSRERLSIQEWIFVADNLAMFPYQVIDEPLYVCKSVENVLTIHGHSILNQFVSQLLPPHPQSSTDDEDVFKPDALYHRLPMDKFRLYDIMDQSQAYFTLIYLKTFLCKMYSIPDAKVQEYTTSEAAKVHEKGMGRKNVHMFYPMTAMEQLKDEVKEIRGTPQGDWQLVHHISQFRRMLLAIDNKEDEEDDEEEKMEEANNEYKEQNGDEDMEKDE